MMMRRPCPRPCPHPRAPTPHSPHPTSPHPVSHPNPKPLPCHPNPCPANPRHPQAWLQGVLMWMTLTPALLLFWRLLVRRYLKPLDHPPLSVAMAAPPAAVDPAVYLPPALRVGALGWCVRGRWRWSRACCPSGEGSLPCACSAAAWAAEHGAGGAWRWGRSVGGWVGGKEVMQLGQRSRAS